MRLLCRKSLKFFTYCEVHTSRFHVSSLFPASGKKMLIISPFAIHAWDLCPSPIFIIPVPPYFQSWSSLSHKVIILNKTRWYENIFKCCHFRKQYILKTNVHSLLLLPMCTRYVSNFCLFYSYTIRSLHRSFFFESFLVWVDRLSSLRSFFPRIYCYLLFQSICIKKQGKSKR